MALIDEISESIKTSMKEKDTVSLESLRAVKSALLLAQTQKGNLSGVSADEEIKILQKLVKVRIFTSHKNGVISLRMRLTNIK